MADNPQPDEIARMAELTAEHLGLNFPEDRCQDLLHKLAPAASEMGFPGSVALVRALTSRPWSRREIDVLARHLTVGETYFFRDEALFRALRGEILPQLLCARKVQGRPIRLWCAGCASGEEPYSLAIVLHGLLPPPRRRTISILATDVNPSAIEKAEAAVYSEWSLRGTPAEVREAFFRQAAKGRYELLPVVREMVTFQLLNLARDPYPSLENGTNAMDLIVCRNVLMYFKPEAASGAIEHFGRALVEGGWLAVSPCEVSMVDRGTFSRVAMGETILHRKCGAGEVQHPIPPSLPSAAVPPATPAWVAPVSAENPPMVSRAEAPAAPSSPPDGAEALYRLGRYADALALLDAAEGARTSSARNLLLGARCLANLGDLGRAKASCERALRADKLDPSAHYLLATVLMEEGRVHEAADALRRALYLEPDFILAHWTMSHLAQKRGERAAAERHLRNARTLLSGLAPDRVVPESDGMTAGRLLELVSLSVSAADGPEVGGTSCKSPAARTVLPLAASREKRP